MRAFSEIQYRSLRTICTAAYDALGSFTVFAKMGRSRVSVSQLSKYASTNDDGSDGQPLFMPIDVAVDVDHAAGQPIITGQMAELLGYRLVPLGSSGQGGAAPVAALAPLSERDAHAVLKETMDVAQAILAALADGRIDALDSKTILKEAHEARRALDIVIRNLEA